MEDFHQELLVKLEEDSRVSERTLKESFFIEYTDILNESDEVIGESEYLHFEQRLLRMTKVVIDGYSYSENDAELTLFIIPKISMYDVETLDKKQADDCFTFASRFYTQATQILNYAEESSEGYALAKDIVESFVIESVKIVILTDKVKAKSLDILPPTEKDGVKISYYIFDLEFLQKANQNKAGKVDLVIDFSDAPIAQIKANQTDTYASYLCSVNGLKLAQLYREYGSRLIEANIRSFLQTRGKVNKGIKETLLKDPQNFFAYNNGLTTTCESVEIENGYIVRMTNLQIVNGGQTTASLANVLMNEDAEEQLKDVFIPMKLSVIDDYELAQDLVPAIAKYANSQNKVSEVDLASNHPFHRRIEEFSRKLQTPIQEGFSYGTYWFYERAAGQYAQETYKLSQAEKKNFEKLHPKSQMFKKSDFAKYFNIMNCKPDVASKGGQTSFKEFSKWIIETWEKEQESISEYFFKKQVANIILFKAVDKLVKEASWYEAYKANINAYSISYFYDYLDWIGLSLDFDYIWKTQEIPREIKSLFEDYIIEAVNDHIRDTKMNVTEYAKKPICWSNLQRLDLLEEVKDELFHMRGIISEKEEEEKEHEGILKFEDTFAYTIEQVRPDAFKNLYEELLRHPEFSVKDLELIRLISDGHVKSLTKEQDEYVEDIFKRYTSE